jgi:hypothetical protein
MANACFQPGFTLSIVVFKYRAVYLASRLAGVKSDPGEADDHEAQAENFGREAVGPMFELGFCWESKMPWKECNRMDERLKFIARLLDGERMAGLCREFGISRKTDNKILTRYNEIDLDGLTDRSRRPYRHANQPHARPQ